MNRLFSPIPYVIVIVVLIFLLFQKECSYIRKDKNIKNDTLKTTSIKYDTIIKDSIIYRPKPYKVIKHDTWYKKVDTLKILQDYINSRTYMDTINLDSLGNVTIYDSISKNQLQFREIKSNITIPTKTITKVVKENEREFYGGLESNISKNGFNYVGLGLLYKDKQYRTYGVGLGVNRTLNPTLSFKMYWKFSSKKQ